jgi:phage terminase large subunit-like protein
MANEGRCLTLQALNLGAKCTVELVKYPWVDKEPSNLHAHEYFNEGEFYLAVEPERSRTCELRLNPVSRRNGDKRGKCSLF